MIEGHGDDIYGKQDIKMNFSSNIYPNPNNGLKEHLRQHLGLISHYPPPAATELERLLAEEHEVSEQEVMVTSGATDAIYLIAQTFREERTFKLFPPTFSEYEDACRIFSFLEHPDGALCWLCTPNNPTGDVVNNDYIRQLSRQHKWVVADQSYEDYTSEERMSAKDAISLGNVIQIRSLTKKHAIPGLRIGFVTAPEAIISRLRAQYRLWAVNALAIEAGIWLTRHQKNNIPDIKALLLQTQTLREQLLAIDGIDVMPTKTTFMLCTLKKNYVDTLKDYLIREHHILIRDASNFKGLTPHHFRIATQTEQENNALVKAVREFQQLSNNKKIT